MLILDVPNTVLFHYKVDWLSLYLCAAVIFLTHFVGLIFRVMNNKQQKINPKYGALAGIIGIILSSFL
uniref:Uncharacterized protein n=1 Tax=Panagrolaimus sp. PS1159 TaxID=55785 RepID=A0AC35EZ00_9BILA